MLKNFFKNLCKNFKKKLGFSPVELMVTLVAVSVIAGSMTPVVTKQMSSQKQVAINPNQVTTQCSAIDEDGYCTHCTESKCLECTRPCPDHARLNVEYCKCEACNSAFDNCNTCDDNKCTKCDKGFYLERSAFGSKPSCVACPKGHYCDGLNKIVCPEGTYADSTKWHECKPCPPGKYQSNSSSNSDIKNHYKCGDCPKGKYCPEWRSTVGKQCEPGTYQDQTGQTTCKKCACGSASNETGRTSACPSCAAGTVSRGEGNVECVAADIGHYSAAGACVTTKCAAGTYASDKGTATCSNCADGYISGIGQPRCTACPAGYYKYSANTCVRCLPGKWSSAASNSCSDCPAGYYCPATVPANCNFTGASFSSNAEIGATKVNQANSCTTPPVKIICPIGKCCPAGSSGPTDCPAGTYRATEGGSTANCCTACPTGHISAAGASKCTPCPAGTAPNAAKTVCEACRPGKYMPTSGTHDACINCPCGSYQDEEGKTSCKTCPNLQYSSAGAASCIAVSPGYWTRNQSGACQQYACPQGYQCGASPGACTCGYYQPSTTQSSCIACPVGKYNPNWGQTACTNCPAGYYQASTAQCGCNCCPAGQYQDSAGQGSCKACPKGKKCPNECMTVGIECPIGYYQDETGKTDCKCCPAGYYQDETGKGSCKACPKGYKCPGTCRTTAECCPAGYYQDETGKTECKPCPKGHYCPGTCRTDAPCCPAGQYQPNTGQTGCLACPEGHYCPGTCRSDAPCCPAGQYQPYTGRDSCYACSAGYECPGTCRTTQSACPCGYYQPSEGQTSCEASSAGYYTSGTGNTGATGCCAAGQYSAAGACGCSSCSAGYYQTSSCSSSCSTPCSNIHPNCTSCNAATGECTACSGGYSVSNGTCVAACSAENCDTCYAGEPNKCFVCRTGYVPEAQSGTDYNGNSEEWMPTGNCSGNTRCSSYIWYCNKCFLGANYVSGVSFYQCYECGCGYRPVFLQAYARGADDYSFPLQACTNCDLAHTTGERCGSAWYNNCSRSYYYCDDEYEKQIVMSATCEKHDGPYTWEFSYKNNPPSDADKNNVSVTYSSAKVGPAWQLDENRKDTTGFYTSKRSTGYYSAPAGACTNTDAWPGESSAPYNKVYCTPSGLYNKSF